MTTLNGRWTLRAIGHEAGWKQRILISGSQVHDGGHEMVVGTELQHVEGDEITIQAQALNQGTNTWTDSLQQESFDWDDQVGLTLTISADDNPPNGDLDFNDLVVLCVAEDDELRSPHVGYRRPDLTIPENRVRFR